METILLLAGGGAVAGAFGALLGLGGGVLMVPLLTLGFGLPFREAVAISLMSVITTSSAGAAVYLRRGLANLRLGMTLELATAIGGLAGGFAAFLLSERLLAAAFSLLLAYTAFSMLRGPGEGPERHPESRAHGEHDAVEAHESTLGGPGYSVRNLPLGMGLSVVAGVISALLGIGGGTVKVPAMHLVMGVPLRVAVATSGLMIGVTASASAIVYLVRGTVDPYVAGPVVVGSFLGASGASHLSHRVPVDVLRLLFVVVLGYVAVEMAARALGLRILAATPA
ncbi:MAG: sulfite exporter TauE/SafE family protein [Chloroflexi bacterium]|nr:sulfite exporter TauE/SafE family protein [Chloroflexota bacterium]